MRPGCANARGVTGIVLGIYSVAAHPQVVPPGVAFAEWRTEPAGANIRGQVMEQREKRTNHPLVCLLSTHPLLLDQFAGTLSDSHFPVRGFRLRQGFFEDVNRLVIPTAKVHVVDGHDPFAQALVGRLVSRS